MTSLNGSGNEPDRFLYLFPDFFDRLQNVGLRTPSERMAWLKLLLGQLRYGYTYSVVHLPPGYPKRRVERFCELGLLEERDGVLHLVDWEEWNGRKEHRRLLNRERQQRFRERKRTPVE